MGELLDKLVLFACCVLLLPLEAFSPWCLAALLSAVCLSSLNSYFPEKFSLLSASAYLAAGCFRPEFFLFVPFLAYDLWRPRFRFFYCLLPVSVLFQLGKIPSLAMAAFFLYTGLSALLKLRTLSLNRSRQAYQNLTDNAKEVSLRLEQKNEDLLEKQDYEIQVATLNERNRIAREIHDSVGHLLSRSILQLGALMAVYRQPPRAERPAGHSEIHPVPGHGQHPGKRPRPPRRIHRPPLPAANPVPELRFLPYRLTV